MFSAATGQFLFSVNLYYSSKGFILYSFTLNITLLLFYVKYIYDDGREWIDVKAGEIKMKTYPYNCLMIFFNKEEADKHKDKSGRHQISPEIDGVPDSV